MQRPVAVFAAMVFAFGASVATAGQAARAAGLVPSVRAAIAKHDFAAGEALITQYRSRQGVTSELAEAVSWLGRGALADRELERSEQYALDAEDLSIELLKTTRVNDDRHLESALGAAIEVQALVKAARGARSEAVYGLKRALAEYGDTVLHKRIQKNINALSLEGQPAIALDTAEHLGPVVPTFDQLKGKVVLLFFWAHWCPDCKAESPDHRAAPRQVPRSGARDRRSHAALWVHRVGDARAAGRGAASHHRGPRHVLPVSARPARPAQRSQPQGVRCLVDTHARPTG